MYVTQHARARLVGRLGALNARLLAEGFEALDGEHGTVAYIMSNLPEHVLADDGSNGDVVVAVAVEGSVETVYFRRSTQDMGAAYFGARKVVDMRVETQRLTPGRNMTWQRQRRRNTRGGV